MTKLELIKALEKFNDDAQIVVAFNTTKYDHHETSIACDINEVSDGWEPANVASIELGEAIMY